VASVGVETPKVDTEEEVSMEDTEAVKEISLKVTKTLKLNANFKV
jgi:hypothetical protein